MTAPRLPWTGAGRSGYSAAVPIASRRSAPSAWLAALVCAALVGCVSVGRDFPAGPVTDLEVGGTTQPEVRERFGEPWRTGFEDGQRTWSYGEYRYSLFGDPLARDLVVKFDDRGVVSSYTYNTTESDR